MTRYCPGYDFVWADVRQLLIDFAWVELYAGQQSEWMHLMDRTDNLSGRVWVHPFEQVLELRYDRYRGNTYQLLTDSTFVVVANFDAFFLLCPGVGVTRMSD